MRRRHNSRMQLLACAVYIINALYLYKLAEFALSHSPVDSYSMHIMTLYVGSYVMEDIQITCMRGVSEASPPACIRYVYSFRCACGNWTCAMHASCLIKALIL